LTARALAAHLKKAMDAGFLRKEDPQFAAELFISMLVGVDRTKRLYGMSRSGGNDAHRAARIVDCFMRTYSTEGHS
jgi:TetR/AcrR family transcriptional repressor of mexJK operon